MAYKPHMSYDAANHLAGAIIKQAVTDYMEALIQNDVVMMSECERFFRGSYRGWFDWLSNGLDGEEIIKIVRKKIALFIKACDEHQPEKYGDEKAAEKAAFTCPCCNSKNTKVKITFPKRKTRQKNVLTFTCPSCHLSVWWQWRVGLILKEQSCDNCLFCQLEGTSEYCSLNGIKITKRLTNCRDWEGRVREPIS